MMRSLGLAAMIATTGCRSIFGIEDTRVIDAQQFDAPIDTPVSNGCIGDDQSLAKICAVPSGAKAFTATSMTLATDDDSMCDMVVGGAVTQGPSLCVILGTTITIGGSVIVTGSRPLVFAASDTIAMTSDGVIDVSSNAVRLGAGHDDPSCTRHDGDGDSGGGGGGAGGTFGGKGGNGGTGDTNDSNPPAGMALGGVSPAKVASISSVRGGCAGGEGGSGSSTGGIGGGGAGGHGGGAVYLIATKTLDLGGRIYASGEGGRSGTALANGGGGGGSGGTVALEAAMVVMHASAAIAANGGGGAGGVAADPTSAQPGDDGSTIDPLSIAGGGQGDTGLGGNAGGAGSSSGSPNGNAGMNAAAGAGGAGGGVGFVWARGTFQLNGAVISPTPQLH